MPVLIISVLIISLDATSYYHSALASCVTLPPASYSRAFLCGNDPYAGVSYEHRRKTIEDRILLLGTIFCIDVCAYTVMSNHHHLVLHINKAESMKLSDLEVCTRWHKLFKGTVLTQKFEHNKTLDKVEREAVQIKLDEWRLQLTSISWFMRALNEPIARQANKDDNVTGCFWDKFLLLQNLHFVVAY